MLVTLWTRKAIPYIDGLVQERRNSIANTLEFKWENNIKSSL